MLKIVCVEFGMDEVVTELFPMGVEADATLGLIEIVDDTVTLFVLLVVANNGSEKLVAIVMLTTLGVVLASSVGVLGGGVLLSPLFVKPEPGAEAAATSDVLKESTGKSVLLGTGVGVGVDETVLQDWIGAGNQVHG